MRETQVPSTLAAEAFVLTIAADSVIVPRTMNVMAKTLAEVGA